MNLRRGLHGRGELSRFLAEVAPEQVETAHLLDSGQPGVALRDGLDEELAKSFLGYDSAPWSR